MTRPVLLCYDGSESAAAAIAAAGELLGGGEAIVAHVWAPPAYVAQWDPVTGAPPYPDPELQADLRRNAEQAGRRIAEEGVKRANAAGFVAEPLAVPAARTPWHAIVELGEERSARAIVVGSRGRSALKSAVLGSVSSGIAHHAPCPVVLIGAGA